MGAKETANFMSNTSYSIEFKKSIVEKLFQKGAKSVTVLADEHGIARSALYRWRQEFSNKVQAKYFKTPQDRSDEEKLEAIISFPK